MKAGTLIAAALFLMVQVSYAQTSIKFLGWVGNGIPDKNGISSSIHINPLSNGKISIQSFNSTEEVEAKVIKLDSFNQDIDLGSGRIIQIRYRSIGGFPPDLAPDYRLKVGNRLIALKPIVSAIED